MATSTHRFLSPPILFSPSLPLFLSPRLHDKLRPHKTSLSISFSSSFSITNDNSKKKASVSIAPIEQAPSPDFNFSDELSRLTSLRTRLQLASTAKEKIRILHSDPRVRDFLELRKGWISRVLTGLETEDVALIKSLVAAGQEHVLGVDLEGGKGEGSSGLRKALYVLGDMVEKWSLHEERVGGGSVGGEEIKKLLKSLGEIEEFYGCVGGIIGYQILILEHLSPPEVERKSDGSVHLHRSLESHFVKFHVPSGYNLVNNAEYASQAALWGIEGLPELGEIYPLGGAGDRLGLVDSGTGECLPAAMLPYCGRTLLEGLIRDLQAREFLYFKIYGKQCITPVAIMTSSVKNNHEHITALCERLGWFGRGQGHFQLFEQPLVPVVAAEDGRWLVNRPLSLLCKPGGHGAIWKLAYDRGVFQWFYSLGRKGATVRQVSNVVAATDLTLLALAGIGLRHGKKLGFASCQRSSGATEGINVLIEKQMLNGQWAYGLTCIEYTEFEKFGITDDASTSFGSLQAEFPANTNVLYVDLQPAERVGSSKNATCLPGMVLNLKKPVSYVDQFGIHHSVSGGRLECTMQNIADNFLNTYTSKCNDNIESALDTFIVYNERKRVTSSAKRKRKLTDKSLHQTPDGSLLDVIRNAADLLSHCDIEIPQIEDNTKYFNSGPPFLILLHPALGPLWEVARQKFSGGSVSAGSELQIEAAEFLWRDVELDGSLIVVAENLMGSLKENENGEPILHYGHRCGRCKLQNVKVMNKGINWMSGDNVYWKHDVQRFETLKIVLQGNAEFEATDVVLQGHHVFEVPNGYKMRIISDNPGFAVTLDTIQEEMMDIGSWFWKYKIEGTHIRLEKIEL